jgi:hypothetical protein
MNSKIEIKILFFVGAWCLHLAPFRMHNDDTAPRLQKVAFARAGFLYPFQKDKEAGWKECRQYLFLSGKHMAKKE